MEQNQAESRVVEVEGRRIAVRHRDGRAPGMFWLGGYNSVMSGAKAEALDRFCAGAGHAATRFDYSGCGESGGDFASGTISRWLDEAEAVFNLVTEGPQVLVGSSMGGWLALLLNKRLRGKAVERVKAMVLVAPAVDMTHELMRASLTPEEAEKMVRDGRIERVSAYSDEPLVITRALLEDGDRHLLFGAPIEAGCPMHVIQGARDPDVSHGHALRLVSHLLHDEVSLTLVPDGDHRLSRPQDLERLEAALGAAFEAEG